MLSLLPTCKIEPHSLSSPLDDLINQLGGPGKVAEMTGRRGRVVKTDKQPQPHYEARESDSSSVDSLNIQEVRLLNPRISLENRKHLLPAKSTLYALRSTL